MCTGSVVWGLRSYCQTRTVYARTFISLPLSESARPSHSGSQTRSTIRRTLRFVVGERVECKTGKKEWSAGEVVALMFHDKESMPVGQVVPYQIKLDDGELVWAPADKDGLIRKAA